jgi:hypothetical protein
MGPIILALRMCLLAATAIVGVIGAYHGIGELIDDHGYGREMAVNAVAFLTPLAATLVGGVLYLLSGRRRYFRVHAGGALLLFGLALITVNSLGFYFLTAGALAVLSLCVLATRRASDGAEPYRWLRGAARVRNRGRVAS